MSLLMYPSYNDLLEIQASEFTQMNDPKMRPADLDINTIFQL